jgi:hypothetical protein
VVTRTIERVDPANADAALLLLGIATRNEELRNLENDREWLLLELWGVQAALGRRRGSAPLEEGHIEEIRRCTRDEEHLRWPRKREE